MEFACPVLKPIAETLEGEPLAGGFHAKVMETGIFGCRCASCSFFFKTMPSAETGTSCFGRSLSVHRLASHGPMR